MTYHNIEAVKIIFIHFLKVIFLAAAEILNLQREKIDDVQLLKCIDARAS